MQGTNIEILAKTDELTRGVTRRRFIRGVILGGGLPLLAGCGLAAPAAPAGTSAQSAPPSTVAPASLTAVPAGASKAASAYPGYVPTTGGPKPDFPSQGPLYEDGYSTYPKNPVKALPADPPGLGSKVACYTNNSAPAPPTPYDQNPAWQATNKGLNATVEFTIIAQADYTTKLATVMAGNDLPDIMMIPGVSIQNPGIANLTQFLEAKAADLTPYLAGDAAKDYPNLAALPPFAWKNSACARNGKLYMIPIERYYPGSMLLKNSAVYDKLVGPGYVPKNADDFKRVLQELTRPSENQWGMGNYANQMFYIYYYAAMFGAPNTWALDASGKLTRDIETPQYKEAVAYVRDLVASGLYHPDALTIADSTIARNNFIGSKYVLDVETFGNAWQDGWTRGPKLSPPVVPQAVLPFAAHDGGNPQHYFGKGYLTTTALKQAPPERIKELLRIINWLAAPFGSAEDLLLTVGVKDDDYSLDAQGNIAPTAKSNTDANSVPWKYIVQRPQVAYWPGIPEYAKAATDFEKVVVPVGVADPTLGYASATFDAHGVQLSQALTDGITDVLAGRRPLGDFDQIVKDWQNNGGNQMRTELQQAIAASA
jgi:putative aldouronate transport system substrate-binding protein